MNNLLKWKNATPIPIEFFRNPFLSLQHDVDNAFRDFYDIFSSNKSGLEQFEKLELLPSMDIVEDADNFSVQVEMPGMDEKDIKVSFSDNALTISGEKSISKKNENKQYLSREINYGKYERVISLPSTVDVDKAKASFKKGMLWVVLPKKAETKNRSRDIKIEQV